MLSRVPFPRPFGIQRGHSSSDQQQATILYRLQPFLLPELSASMAGFSSPNTILSKKIGKGKRPCLWDNKTPAARSGSLGSKGLCNDQVANMAVKYAMSRWLCNNVWPGLATILCHVYSKHAPNLIKNLLQPDLMTFFGAILRKIS